jgi:hypothetical protein
MRQQLGEDAVLGGRIRRGPQPDDGVGQQRVRAEQHQQAAQHLDRIAQEHHPPLGQGIGKGAHEWCQHHVKQREHGHQCSALPLGGAVAAQQFHGGDEQGIVGQRAEKLRCHDGVETALHCRKENVAGQRMG